MSAGSLLTGYIPPEQRTQEQADLDQQIKSTMPRMLIPYKGLAKGEKVRLTDSWAHPLVVADVGYVFDRFVQLTGSCVGVGAGNAVFSLSGTQRLLSQNPTKAFVPWWSYPYGRSRFYAGMLRPGSGSFGSAMAKALITDGVFDDKQPGLPAFSRTDGLQLTEALELQWSDGDSSLVEGWLETGRKYPVGAATEVRDTSGLETGLINGYSGTFACNYYPGSGQIMGSGENACLVGKFDTYGPHQVSIHSVWNNPDLGLLFWVQNSWPKSVYPRDPAGGPVCGLWVKETDMQAAFRYSAECFLLSHLNWFPAQPEVLNYFV